jgi:hypothetical protein
VAARGEIEWMTVERSDVVDFVGINSSGDAVLTISDHLAWVEVNAHLFCLQEKVNAYLRFIESGEIYERFPEAAGRQIIIEVVLKYSAPASVEWFFEKTSAAIESAGFRLKTRPL